MPQINRFRGSDSDGRFFSANTFNGFPGFHDDAASVLTVDAGTGKVLASQIDKADSADEADEKDDD